MLIIKPFDKRDIVQNTSEYSNLFSLREASFGITDIEWSAMILADATTDSNSITISMEKTFDGVNFATGVAILTTTDIGDGNPDYVAFNMGYPAPMCRFKATENNNGAIVGLQLYVCIPTVTN